MTKPKSRKLKATPAPANPFLTTAALSAMVRCGDTRAIEYVVAMLKHCGGNVSKLAEAIQVAPRTVYYWRDGSPKLNEAFSKHALGLKGAGRALNAASVRARDAKGAE